MGLDLWELGKEHPGVVIATLLVGGAVGAVLATVWLKTSAERLGVRDERLALLDSRVKQEELQTSRQRKTNKLILAELKVLRAGFAGLPTTMKALKTSLSEMKRPGGRKRWNSSIDVQVAAFDTGLSEVQSSLEKAETLIKAFEDFLAANIEEKIENVRLAADLYQRAAEGGLPVAQLALGQFYYSGETRPADSALALKWFAAAAERGLPEAQMKLAEIYLEGKGVHPDPGKAYAWYTIFSQSDEGKSLKNSEKLRASLGPEEIARAEAMARLFTAGARIGYDKSTYIPPPIPESPTPRTDGAKP